MSQSASAATLPPVTLAWNRNPESDIAGYEVKYGTVSGTYGTTVSAGNSTTTSVSGLTEGVTYYFVVVAVNTAGLRSDPSTQISYRGSNPVPNQAPHSTISIPSDDINITVGATLSFSGSGSDPDGNTPLTYRWNFGNGSGFVDSTSQNPGIRRFNTAGIFEVTLTVTDSLGLADPTPATLTVTVSPPNQAPDSTISAPSSTVSITEGGVVYFTGSGSDPDGNVPLTYHWNFGSGSGSADSTEQNPGTRIFKTAGIYVVTFTASDSLGLADQTPATRTITVKAPNQAPDSFVSAPSTTVTIAAGETVSFSGSGSDPDGNTPLGFLWSFGSGSGIPDSSSQNPGPRQFNTAGTYLITLTATDSLGLADPTPATRTVNVTTPVANRAPDSVISTPAFDVTITAGASVEFTGVGNDPDGNTPLTYLWKFGNASGIPDSTAQNPGSLRFNNPGTYVVTFAVIDSKGFADPSPATRTITVNAPPINQAPEAVISAPALNISITAGETVSFASSASDPDGNTPLTYLWDFGNGSGIADSTAPNPGSLQFSNPGSYVVTLTVTDSKGLADSTPPTRTITVQDPSPSIPGLEGWITQPSADLTIAAGESVTFSGYGTDRYRWARMGYRWNFGDGSGIPDSYSRTPGSIQFNNPGTYDVAFTVTNSSGVSDPSPAVRTITVTGNAPANQAPDSTISGPASDISITAGASVTFSGNGSDPENETPLTYRWSFGSGSGIADSTAQKPGSLQFNNPGTYQVSLTATDAQGLADPSPARVTITVTAAKPNQAPDSTISAPEASVTITAGGSVVFSGDGSDPDGNTPLSYLWKFGNASGIADSSARNPEPVMFESPGTYEVSLTVTDAKGLADSTPAKRTVTVLAPPPSIPGLEGWITQPASNLSITAGESVTFSGYGVDKYRWSRMSYRWSFGTGSGIPDSRSQNPGPQQFSKPGIYEVTLTVINPKGTADPSPARVTILVTESTPTPPPALNRETIDGKSYPTFTVTKPLIDNKRVRTVEVSSNLKTWHSGSDHVTVITDDERTLKVRAKQPMSDTPCCYFRLKTTPAPEK